MIITNKPISMAEAKEYLEKDSELGAFVEKFVSLNPEDAKAFKEKLEAMNMIKMKEMHVSKIIDILPEDKEDLNKIFTDVGLDEDETKKILDTVKEFI